MNTVSQDVLLHLNEEAIHTDAFTEPVTRLEEVLVDLKSEFSAGFIDHGTLAEAIRKVTPRITIRDQCYVQTVWVPFRVRLTGNQYVGCRSPRF